MMRAGQFLGLTQPDVTDEVVIVWWPKMEWVGSLNLNEKGTWHLEQVAEYWSYNRCREWSPIFECAQEALNWINEKCARTIKADFPKGSMLNLNDDMLLELDAENIAQTAGTVVRAAKQGNLSLAYQPRPIHAAISQDATIKDVADAFMSAAVQMRLIPL